MASDGDRQITLDLYPLRNFLAGQKPARLEKDTSVQQRMERMKENYKRNGMRTYVEGVLLAHEHRHPHVTKHSFLHK